MALPIGSQRCNQPLSGHRGRKLRWTEYRLPLSKAPLALKLLWNIFETSLMVFSPLPFFELLGPKEHRPTTLGHWILHWIIFMKICKKSLPIPSPGKSVRRKGSMWTVLLMWNFEIHSKGAKGNTMREMSLTAELGWERGWKEWC